VSKALNGIRVLDFSWSVAGPTITRIMASMGAEVMKVEWPGHPDPMRTAMFADDSEPDIDNGSFFAGLNIGKQSLTLNAGSEAGMQVIEKLIRESDVVVESFSAKMLRRWGLDYEKMASINPRIVYLSVSGFGHGGPYESYDTWGPTAQAFSGLTITSGLPYREPAGWGYSYMDICAGYMGTVAMLSALHVQRTTGVGQYVDIAQAEVGISLTGPAILDAQVNDRDQTRPGFPPGNRAVWPGLVDSPGYRGETGAPYGIYPTSDPEADEAYCAITVLSDGHWASLRAAMGDPSWATDDRFATHVGRVDHQDEIDARLSEWTSPQLKHELMVALQQAGVPAGALQNARELLEVDPQARARTVFETLDHPLLGRRQFESVPIDYEKTPIEYREQWPVLSTGNAHILGDIAGLSPDEISRLDEDHVLWPEGLPRAIPVTRPLW
jgi:crotonobetainyl-CoA:carnitine CoA-transferase CaiB-like acyl-CoA transferase